MMLLAALLSCLLSMGGMTQLGINVNYWKKIGSGPLPGHSPPTCLLVTVFKDQGCRTQQFLRTQLESWFRATRFLSWYSSCLLVFSVGDRFLVGFCHFKSFFL